MKGVPIVEMSLGGFVRRIAVCEVARWPQAALEWPPLTVRGHAAVSLLRATATHGTTDASHDGSRKLMTDLRKVQERDRDVILFVNPGAVAKVLDELMAKGARPWTGSSRPGWILRVEHQGRTFLVATMFAKRVPFRHFTLVPRADRQLLWRLCVTAAARDTEIEIVSFTADMPHHQSLREIVEQADDGAVIVLACLCAMVRDDAADTIHSRWSDVRATRLETPDGPVKSTPPTNRSREVSDA